MKTHELHQMREELRKWIVKWSLCGDLQDGEKGEKDWPCGTCACAVLGMILDESSKEYKEHNDPPDRINEIWRAFLEIKDAKLEGSE